MKKFDIDEVSPCWSIFLVIVDHKTKTMKQSERNPTLITVTLTSKNTTKHTTAIRKALEMHTERSTKTTCDCLKRMVEMLHFN